MDRWENANKNPNIVVNDPPPGAYTVRPGTLNITRLNGYSKHAPHEAIEKITRAVDLWIEDNYTLLKSVTVSKNFYEDLKEACFGKEVKHLETLVGDCDITVDPDQTEDVVVA